MTFSKNFGPTSAFSRKMGSLGLFALSCQLMIHPNPAHAEPAEPRLVFAHNHAYAPYGRTVEGYKQDMREAQKAGIDGFAINFGCWDGENGYYKRKVAMFFQAAQELGTGFKLFLSPDGVTSANPNINACVSPREVRDAMELYAGHPNYWKYQGRPVLSSWHGGGQGPESLQVWKSVLEPLRAKGINVYFVPFFYAASYNECPASYDELKANYNGTITNARDFKQPYTGWWSQVVDGMYSSAVAGLPVYQPPHDPSVLDYGETLARLMHDSGKTYMASVAPYYWGQKQGTRANPGRRYFEYKGGKGLEAQWKSLIEKQKPNWVELFTWNDYTESTYFSPVQQLTLGEPALTPDYSGAEFFPTHSGFLELNRYFVQWYKTGQKPPITEDKLYYFYRRHPQDAAAPNDPGGPVVDRHGDIQDALYVTTMLIAPAELRVNSGGKISSIAVAMGMVHTTVPFQPGPQELELWRGPKRLLQAIGSPIEAATASYNFHVNSGFASAKAYPDLVVTDVNAKPETGTGQYTLSATVQNVGGAIVPAGSAIQVEFVVESGGASQIFHSNAARQSLAQGQSISMESPANAWHGTAGSHRIWARVSAASAVPEANDWNNTGTKGSSTTIAIGP